MMRWEELKADFLAEGMNDGKATWFADRQLARENGELPEPVAIEEPVLDLSIEQQEIARRLGRGVYRVSEYPIFRGMICTQKYTGDGVYAVRRQVDELDNVTVWMAR
jgi:hypothetical protein